MKFEPLIYHFKKRLYWYTNGNTLLISRLCNLIEACSRIVSSNVPYFYQIHQIMYWLAYRILYTKKKTVYCPVHIYFWLMFRELYRHENENIIHEIAQKSIMVD